MSLRKVLMPLATMVALLAALMSCTSTTPAVDAGATGGGRNPGGGQGGGRNTGGNQTTDATAVPTGAIVSVPIIAVDGVLTLASPPATASFETSGRVIAVNVRPGMSVKTGDVLAMLDGTALSLTLQLAQEKLALQQAQIAKSLAPALGTDLDTARASLASAHASYNIARQSATALDIDSALRSWNQAKNTLYNTQLNRDSVCATNKGGKCDVAELGVKSAEVSERAAHDKYLVIQQPPTQDKLTQSWSGVVQAQTALAKLEASATTEQKKIYDLQLAQATLAVQRAQRDLAKLKLLSPCDCRVQAVTLALGGTETGSVTLLEPSQLQFQTTNLSERDVINVRPGMKAVIRLKAVVQPIPAKVGVILPISSGAQGTTALFTTLITPDVADPALLPGMTGQAEIATK